MQQSINYWTNTCKFKIDKLTYSTWYPRTTTYDVSKNKQLGGVYCILKRKDAVKFFKTRTVQAKKSFREENHETQGLNNCKWLGQFSFTRTHFNGQIRHYLSSFQNVYGNIHPNKIIVPVSMERAIAPTRPQRRYTFITGAITILS